MHTAVISATAVYPRLRGGTWGGAAALFAANGLSPPTRGNRLRSHHPRGHHGSIPAYAGEPTVYAWTGTLAEVYPRLRGGTAPCAISTCHALVYPRLRGGTVSHMVRSSCMNGLSPPTRGNLVVLLAERPADGSIPAYAGEPAAWSPLAWVARVYPRLRGGT